MGLFGGVSERGRSYVCLAPFPPGGLPRALQFVPMRRMLRAPAPILSQGRPLRLVRPESCDAFGQRGFVVVVGDDRRLSDDLLYGRFGEDDERGATCKSFQGL